MKTLKTWVLKQWTYWSQSEQFPCYMLFLSYTSINIFLFFFVSETFDQRRDFGKVLLHIWPPLKVTHHKMCFVLRHLVKYPKFTQFSTCSTYMTMTTNRDYIPMANVLQFRVISCHFSTQCNKLCIRSMCITCESDLVTSKNSPKIVIHHETFNFITMSIYQRIKLINSCNYII